MIEAATARAADWHDGARRRGLAMGVGAYVLWGLSALYWPLLVPAGVDEIVAHRIGWSVLALAVLVTWLGRWPQVGAVLRSPRVLRLTTVAAALTAVNLAVFIFAATHGRVIEAAMGFFIAPLVMVALGTWVLGERPSRAQWAAVALGAVSVVVLTLAHGGPPWIAVALAGSFGTYGLVKKRAGAGAFEGMMVETAILAPVAAVILVLVQVRGGTTFGQVSATHSALLVGSGLALLAPMLLFNAAGNRIPLSGLGLLQYIEPSIQFLIGLVIFAELMPVERWTAFALVWVAIGILVRDLLRPTAGPAGRSRAQGIVVSQVRSRVRVRGRPGRPPSVRSARTGGAAARDLAARR